MWLIAERLQRGQRSIQMHSCKILQAAVIVQKTHTAIWLGSGVPVLVEPCLTCNSIGGMPAPGPALGPTGPHRSAAAGGLDGGKAFARPGGGRKDLLVGGGAVGGVVDEAGVVVIDGVVKTWFRRWFNSTRASSSNEATKLLRDGNDR